MWCALANSVARRTRASGDRVARAQCTKVTTRRNLQPSPSLCRFRSGLSQSPAFECAPTLSHWLRCAIATSARHCCDTFADRLLSVVGECARGRGARWARQSNTWIASTTISMAARLTGKPPARSGASHRSWRPALSCCCCCCHCSSETTNSFGRQIASDATLARSPAGSVQCFRPAASTTMKLPLGRTEQRAAQSAGTGPNVDI